MKKKSKLRSFLGKLEHLIIVQSIRNGLINIIPILLIGAFSLILKTFPVDAYQDAIANFAGGFILQILNIIYSATFGALSLYMTFSISRSYMDLRHDPDTVTVGAIISSVISFFIFAGIDLESFSIGNMGPKSMFLAIITAIGASRLYIAAERFFKKRRHKLYSKGADRMFNRMLSTFSPIAVTVIVFALIDALAVHVFKVESFRELVSDALNDLFAYGEVGFAKGFCFVLLSSVLWFFGIHGSDVLEGVMQTYFAPGLAVNQAAVTAGQVPDTILNKQFFDCFVLMGGCGTTICLLIAILIFSRNRARKGLGIAASFPMLFNINELMVFGLPIIYNPIMLIPFLLVPLVCYSVSYGAIAAGLVPAIANEVEWTTPIILGGFRATGSSAGAILQLVNVIIGVLIYMPFVRMLDRNSHEAVEHSFESFMVYFKKNEQNMNKINLSEIEGIYGDLVRELTADIGHNIKENLQMAYQPQYDHDWNCVGVEALLRWKHPVYGLLYPPLVVKVAEEGGFLAQFEEAIFVKALSDREAVLKHFGNDIKLSINVTGTNAVTHRFLQFCRQLDFKDPFEGKNICIEVTEQATLSFNKETIEILNSLKAMGLKLAIDDFSMGQTSVNYLKENIFDLIKLDGSLVKGMAAHKNCREIISSIVSLADSLNMIVLAECVENMEQRDALHELGCNCYQGYLFSPAIIIEGHEKVL